MATHDHAKVNGPCELEIETRDRRLAFDIVGTGNPAKAGTVVQVSGGATIEFRGVLVRKAIDVPEVLQFIVDASVNGDLALLAAWLYDKVRGRAVPRIAINRRLITEITKEGIRQVLEEEIRKQ